MFRARFKNEIVAEFLPPLRPRKRQKLIVLCDGMQSIPRKQPLSEFLAAKGFWVIYPRYRGAWESGGEFLAKSPHEDILDVLDELPKELKEIAFGQRFRLAPDQVFVIGGSFGGAAAILLSLYPLVKRVVANCSVVDWSILDTAEKPRPRTRTTLSISVKRSGTHIGSRMQAGTSFVAVRSTILGTAGGKSRVPRLMFHGKDDPNVPYERTRLFAELTGATLKSLMRDGHISTDYVVRRYWAQIKRFFDSAGIPFR